MKNVFLVVAMMLVIVTTSQAQVSDSSNTTPIAPTVVNNLPSRGVTTAGQYFVEIKEVVSNGGTEASFMGSFNGWNPENGASFKSHYAGKDYYVYDRGVNLKGKQIYCIFIGNAYLPTIGIINGTEAEGSTEVVDNYNKDGKNYSLIPQDYGVTFVPK